MSCFLVENGHIDVLVNAFAEHDLLNGRDPKAIGQILWTENSRSVNYRYSERSRHPQYVLHTTEAPLHPVAVLKAIDGYTYQSCERPDWERSAASKIALRLRQHILDADPELAELVPSQWDTGRYEHAYEHHPAYQEAPWSFDSVEQAAAVHY